MFLCLFFYCFMTLLSQLNNVIFHTTLGGYYIVLVNPFDERLFLRKTLFTQSIYLFAGFLTFLYIKFCYKTTWDKYLFIGALLLAFYGIYEIVFFSIFGETGDFLSNRTFGHGDQESKLGSYFQTTSIGIMSIMRLKSLTGEPSMYAFSILPFCIYALHTEKYKIAYLLFATLLLSTSTTAILGIILYLFFIPIFGNITRKWLYGMFFIVISVVAIIFIT